VALLLGLRQRTRLREGHDGRFRRFLKAKYGSDEALRAAWGRPSASIETAEIAGLEERYAAADPPFRDPKAGRAAIDALKCHQGSVADAIIRFCEIAKLNWPRRSWPDASTDTFSTSGQEPPWGGI
jgi:hypothetical protein